MRGIYQLPFLSYREQMDLLKNRGLFFENEIQALKVFEHISYCRFNGYFHPFWIDKQSKVFKKYLL
jgi:abortive infection bacteriophage resistance protein